MQKVGYTAGCGVPAMTFRAYLLVHVRCCCWWAGETWAGWDSGSPGAWQMRVSVAQGEEIAGYYGACFPKGSIVPLEERSMTPCAT